MEPGLAELLQSAKANGLLRATESCAEAVAETDLSLVCVGTPSTVTGALDLQYVRRVTEQIAAALAAQTGAPRARLPQHHAAGQYRAAGR